jgi:serine/threonine protein kinase
MALSTRSSPAAHSPPGPLEPGRLVAGRYRIEAVIGEGGMGVVYRVRHIHTDEALAMKVLHAHVLRDDSAATRFRREARAPARIASEHIARVTDADTAPDLAGAPFYVMELLEGTDLERLVHERGPLAPAVVVELLRQAARALDRAHAIGIVHRDLKPENLFLASREDGSPLIKLLDFGIARIADDAPDSKKTQAGYVFGTPAYMAPEQTVGDIERIGPATDVWALGLVAFKLLTGREYWQESCTAQLLAAILASPMVAPSAHAPWLGPAFDAWFARCVARTASERFQECGDAVVALAGALSVPLRSSSAPPSLESLGPSARPSLRAASLSLRTASAGTLSSSIAPQAIDGQSRRRNWRRSRLWIAVACAPLVLATALLVPRVASHPSGETSAASAPESVPGPEPQASAIPVATTALSATPDSEAEPAAWPAGTSIPAPRPPSLTHDQRERLGVLDRLCGQGTFTEAECRSKKLAILRQR